MLDNGLDAIESAAANEEDIPGIDIEQVLLGMLPPALGGDAGDGPLQDFQQRLLDPLSRHIPGDGNVGFFPADLVDLINVDDAPFGPGNIKVTGLEQPQEDVLHIFPHVPGLGEGRGIGDGKGDIQEACQRLGDKGLARTGRAHQQDVALFDFHIVMLINVGRDALVVIVDRHGHGPLGPLLSNDVLVQLGLDLLGSRNPIHNQVFPLTNRSLNYLRRGPDTSVADAHPFRPPY